MRPALHATVWLAAALVAVASGCHRTPAVEVGAIRVAQGALADPLREAGLDEGTLERAARDALGASGFRGGDPRTAHRARVDVLTVKVTPAHGGGGLVAEVTVELELAPAEGASGFTARESGTGAAPLGGSAPAEGWSRALAAAAREAAGGLAIARAEAVKPMREVIADLASPDSRLRGHAVRALAERRDPAAVPALVQRLSDPDPDVVHRTVGALAQIHDPRAVGPLIDVSRKGDDALAARVARIIGDIGGPEARGYLLTVEAGHPDPRVQRAAREALEEMRARDREAARVAAER
ncbi:HEAT repeat domain-containing protein [Anaeromyxobacter oryzae]|uniref:PBS lyase HEAT domain protein repeat-containing protein n=1 Tax=Anaeromyxobacter oryzae TaxID=2918170 RepID=A0ABN6N3I4_9BACT|nr:HEAT repeat domain-containing protein [Anaeromyxobacter oryzae]BDG06494.1 hypothetical protein AMOR_54900 [Anaeromyxobacter oryzae]